MSLWCTLLSVAIGVLAFVSATVTGQDYEYVKNPVRPMKPGHHNHKIGQHSHKQIKVPEAGESHDVEFLANDEVMHDHDHLEEELPAYLTAEKIKEMTPAEKDFHYFKLHDYDNNRQLDGLELLSALTHVVHLGNEDSDRQREEERDASLSVEERMVIQGHRRKQRLEKKKQVEDFYIQLIDKELKELDADGDGMLGYFEYIVGRRRVGKTNIKLAY